MERRTFSTLLVASVVATGASAAWAVHTRGPGEVDATIDEVTGAPGGGPFPAFGALDANGDRRLSADEVRGVETLSRQFEAADVNQDGGIDAAEFSAFETTEGVMPGVGAVGDEPAAEPTHAPPR